MTANGVNSDPNPAFIAELKKHNWDMRALALDVAAGNLPGWEYWSKHGGNPSVDTTEEDIWNQGGTETLLTSAATMYASATDTGATAEEMMIIGLGPDWKRQLGKVTLNGQNQVAITDLDGGAATWLTIDRVFQRSASPAPADASSVYIAETDTLTGGVPNTASKIHAKVDYGDAAQQTEKALLTVPSGMIGYILSVHTRMLSATGTARSAKVRLETSSLAEGATVGSPSWYPRRSRHELGISTNGPRDEHEFHSAVVCSELTRIHMRATTTTASEILATFDILLAPEG